MLRYETFTDDGFFAAYDTEEEALADARAHGMEGYVLDRETNAETPFSFEEEECPEDWGIYCD